METLDDILNELEIVIEKHPDQRIYDICRVKNPDRYIDELETIPTARIEGVTLRSLTRRIDKASESMRRCLKMVHKLSKDCMKTSDPSKLGEALYKIFDETRYFK